VALVPIASSTNVVTNRSLYAQYNLINDIGQCYILGLTSFSCTYFDEQFVTSLLDSVSY